MTEFFRLKTPNPLIPPEWLWATFIPASELSQGYTYREHAKYMYDNNWIDEQELETMFRKSAGKDASKGTINSATEAAREYIHSGYRRRTTRQIPDQRHG